MPTPLTCRFCSAPLSRSFADLGLSPLANSYVAEADLLGPETFWPLHAYVCEQCLLVQLPPSEAPEAIFSDYAYFSSYSDSWLAHAKAYVEQVSERFALGPQHRVIEIASNDGYLLRWFVERGVPVLGVEPAANVAEVARENGIRTVVEFLGEATARALREQGEGADLLVGNNVLAHVPDLNDFVTGLGILLEPTGVLTMEFPHLLRLMAETQFDTIYHEHFSYYSLLTVEQVFAHHGLVLFDVEELPTHGGSLRVYCMHRDAAPAPTARVVELRERERAAGLGSLEAYDAFREQVLATKRSLLRFALDAKAEGRSIAAYGAAAKGNTLLNYCGVGRDFVDYVVDRSPHKQGRYLPGTRIPIRGPEAVAETRPDYLLLLAWNLKDEIMEQMAHIREWGGRFVVPVPEARVHD
ncbi:MAG: class I SAM-dependent methyltransferase [Thermoleophilia bacterium]